MNFLGWRTPLLALIALQLGLAGCATPQRLSAVPVASMPEAAGTMGTTRFLVSRESDSFKAEAMRSLEKEKVFLASKGWSPEKPLPPVYLLAISGGGDNGAYGAGFLSGWSATGRRPEFKVVTGISTGALIAPFAFLGPKYDYVLQRVYTETSQKDIFKKRGLLGGLFGDGMADTRPLAKVIDSYVTPALLGEIAEQYTKGRLLLVGTTNLDSLEPVVWNMTAIAASKDADAIILFRKVLLASASIPGAFPPVMIDATVGGTHYQEMHVDGGTMAQVFAYPPSMSMAGAPDRKRALYILRNARLDADWMSVERRTLSIATRAIFSLTRTQGVGDLYRIYATSERDHVDFNLTFIPASFNTPHREEFDTAYMRALFEVGVNAAKSEAPWHKVPPGFAADSREPPTGE
jgi:Patatin-like phospholipase